MERRLLHGRFICGFGMLTSEIIQGFVKGVLAKNFDEPVDSPDCHKEWWDLCCSKSKFVAIAAPRGFAKSTAITHAYVLAAALFRDRKFIVIVSDTEGQAVMFLQDIKRELLNNDTLSVLFKLRHKGMEVELAKDSETDIIVEFEDSYQFRIVARGAGQRVRGLKWGSRRPDLIVCDDLENDEIVLNRDRRNKFKQWFNGALLPIRSDRGVIRVVGTILHMDSLLENLMPEQQLAQLRRPRKNLIDEPLKQWTEVRTPWKSIKYRAHTQDWSHLLWPTKKTREWLESEREKYIVGGLPEIYAQEYLNQPLDESFALFRKSDFLPLRDEDLQKNVNFYITVDLAVSEKDRADYTVFTVGALDSDGLLGIRNVIRERIDAREIVERLIQLQRLYKPIAIGVEEGVIQKSILPFLREQMIRQGGESFINLFPLKPSVDKITRCRSIQARMRAGGVRFMKDADWFSDLEAECLRFPRDRHDDQVDTLSYLGLMLDKLQDAVTPEEEAEDAYERELSDSGLDRIRDGRSPYTGY